MFIQLLVYYISNLCCNMFKDLEDLVVSIQATRFDITKEELLRPNSNLVVRFYKHFLTEFKEQIQCLAGPYSIPLEYADKIETEDEIFQAMYHIFEIHSIKLKLADIYEPYPVRTKSMLKVCCHLLSYAESTLEDGEKIGNSVFKIKQNVCAIESQFEPLLLEIEQNATKKTQLMEEREKLSEELLEVKLCYDEKKDSIKQNEKMLAKMKKQIDIERQLLQKEEQELVKLESKEAELTEQVVSDAEHTNLLQIIKNLEVDSQTISNDEINMMDSLTHQNNVLLHYQNVLKIVPDVANFNLERVETLIKLHDDLKNVQLEIVDLKKNRIDPLKMNEIQSREDLKRTGDLYENLSNENQQAIKEYLQYEEEYCLVLNKTKDESKKDFNHNNRLLELYSQEIKTLEMNKTKLLETFYSEYNAICKAEDAMKNFAKALLSRISDS